MIQSAAYVRLWDDAGNTVIVETEARDIFVHIHEPDRSASALLTPAMARALAAALVEQADALDPPGAVPGTRGGGS